MCRKFLCLVSFMLVFGAVGSASGALPSGWQDSDVGTPLPGSANESAGVFTVTGNGNDIWDNTDSFHYAYKLLDGDGEMIARVLSIGGPSANEWRKAGVMVRETLTGPSTHAFMAMTATTGGPTWTHASSFQGRTTTGGASVNTDLIPAGYAGLPWWVRLTRSGNDFTASVSPDGVTWTVVASRETIMTSSVYIGLAVTSHEAGSLSTCTFDSVSYSGNVHGFEKASSPQPSDGGMVDADTVVLQWSPGESVAQHDVYFSSSFNDVNTATSSDPMGSDKVYKARQTELVYPPGEFDTLAVTRGVTYYWRIDEINGANTWRGNIWSFTVVPNINYDPIPADHATFVPITTDVSWSKGNWALKGHIVYFSTDFNIVNNAVPGTTGVPGYLAPTPPQTVTSTTRTVPGDLLYNTTYYWRADTVEKIPPATPGNTHKGDIWEFKTTVQGTGSILREIWENVTPAGSTSLADLYAWPDFPYNPTTSVLLTAFDTVPGLDNFGGRIHGWVFAPVSGDYTFYLASDDNGELWLSTDDNPANVQLLASENAWAGDKAWQMGPEMSAPIPLVGGNKYYISALWKEGGGGDNCAVGWTGPDTSTITVIPGAVLMPFVQYWAYDPIPANEAIGVAATTTIDWVAGRHAASHDVYFGTSYDDVKAGTGGTFKGNQALADHDYDPPGALEAGKAYFWKITEVNDLHVEKKWEGPVWVFRVAGGAGGLLGAYYHHTGGASPAGFETFVLSRIDPQINFGWGDPGSPDPLVNVDQFSCRWTGQVDVPTSGDYIFYPATDDGERLWVDGQLVVDQWWDQGTTEVASAPIALVAGQKYDIKMEQYENAGGAAAYLRWSGPATPKQIIPAIWLWPPTKATNPVPLDGSTTVPPQQPTLSWTAGVYAAAANGHKVYFDADAAKVLARAGCQVNGAGTTNPSYLLPYTFGLEKTFYWAVDEVNGVNSWAGDVWSFTTANNKVVDDMEKYVPAVADPNIWQRWVDGSGDCGSIPGNNSGATVDIELFTYLGGVQAMKLLYDNDGTVFNPCTSSEQSGRLRYSKVEAQVSTLPSGIGSDWTVGGAAKSLSLRFYGDPNNAIDPLWVQLTDASNNKAKVLYGAYTDENTSDMKKALWHEWLINLADFTGVNVGNVKSIAIGIGNEAGGSSGTGTLYFDDIRLYTPRCVLARRPAAFAKFDYAPEGYLSGGDCVVNGLELEVMMRDWLEADYTAPSLLARYLFEGNYNDASGNGHTGTPVGAGITFVADPTRGQVLDLPGGDNIYVDCNAVGISGAMPRSIACWAKADNTTIPDWTLVFGFTGMADGTGGNGSHFNIDSIGGPGGVGAHCWGWEETIFTDTEALEWRHYAMTYDGTTIKYYGDGVPMDTDPAKSNVQNLVHADRLFIGKRVTQASSFPGLVDDACVFNKVLTDAEVVAVMNGNAASVSPYHPVPSPANLVDPEAANSRGVNFKDYAELLLKWLDENEWP